MTKPILCFRLTISLIIFLGDSRPDGSNVSQPRLTSVCIYAGMTIVAIVAISFLVVLLCRRRNSHPGMEHSDEVRIEVGHGQLSCFVCAFTSRTRKRTFRKRGVCWKYIYILQIINIFTDVLLTNTSASI